MKIRVEGYQKIQQIEIEAAPVALVCARNEQGKSSLATAVRLALTGTGTPPGTKTKDSDRVINTAMGRALASVESDTGKVEITWPERTPYTTGANPPSASAVAAGLVALPELPEDDRARVFAEEVKALPTEEELAAEVAKALKGFRDLTPGYAAAAAKACWKTITEKGWDKACASMKDRAKELKGEWKGIVATGELWGSEKGENWVSDPIRTDPAQRDRADKAHAAHETAKRELTMLRGELATMRRPRQAPGNVICPHCHQPVEIHGDTVGIPAPFDPNEERAYTEKYEAKKAAVQAAQEAANEAMRELTTARVFVEVTEDEADRRTKQAAAVHQKIMVCLAVAAVIDIDGLRKAKLARSMSEFEGTLKQVAAATGWGNVTLTASLDVMINGWTYRRLSESMQFRAATAIQMAFAVRQSAPMIVIDGADVLDGPGREGLFKGLRALGLKALVTMMVPGTRETAPDIGKAKLGRTYWIENGQVAA